MGLMIFIAAALFLVMSRTTARLVRRDTTTPACLAEYARARTAADTAAVDAHRPNTGRSPTNVAVTCGALRTTGQLR
jgi:hypothetical protein